MANDILNKYTDETYLSKSQLQEALNTSLIDGYWKEVRAYRGKFANRLNVKTLRKEFQMGVVLTPSISGKISLLEANIQDLLSAIRKMNFKEKEEAEKVLFFEALSPLVDINDVSFSDVALKALVSGRYSSDNSEHKPIIAFYKNLVSLVKKEPALPDEDFLGENYSALLGEELTSFYRRGDFDERIKLADLKDLDYPYAPSYKVESFMNALLTAIKDEAFNPIIRSFLAVYYMDVVSPFYSHNKDLSILLGLNVLANSYGQEAFYLPLGLLLEDTDRRKEAVQGVKTGDFTYFLLYSVDILKKKINDLTEKMHDILTSDFRKEAHQLSPEETKAYPHKAEQMSFFDNLQEEKKEEAKEEIKPIIPEVRITPAEPEVKKIVVKKEAVAPKQVSLSKEEISISLERRSLSDKEAKEYTAYLLESNPRLNKKQASFLATHCTLGHYYTIQQYKKFARCAYETARTSMDKLAAERYYEKQQVKNKFVYTPIDMNVNR